MAVHWFNPENDIALASGLSNYTPPKAALMIRDAGQALPLWYSDKDDMLLCHNLDIRWYERMAKDFGINIGLCDSIADGVDVRPWGWSAYTKKTLMSRGCGESYLPTDDQITKMRSLSHRRTATMVAESLRQILPEIPLAPPAIECCNINHVRDAVADFGDVYLKMPWSSSGRGVIHVPKKDNYDNAMRFALDSIRRQGSIMVEKAYDKELDFARLFRCDNGKCTDIGTSVFTTDATGAYTGNLLAPEKDRVAEVARFYNIDRLNHVVKALEVILTDTIAPHYSGILGVDMLIDRNGTLDAVVEINLRCTMGYVANCFADRYLMAGMRGKLVSGHIDRFNERYTTNAGQLASGKLLLSPTIMGFGFYAEIPSLATN